MPLEDQAPHSTMMMEMFLWTGIPVSILAHKLELEMLADHQVDHQVDLLQAVLHEVAHF